MNTIPTMQNRKPLPEPLLLALGQLLGSRLSTSASVREQHGSDISSFGPVPPDAVALWKSDSSNILWRLLTPAVSRGLPVKSLWPNRPIMPLNLARSEVDERRWVARRIDCPGLYRRVGLCVSTRMPSTPARQAVADLIRQVVGDMCLQHQWPGSRVLATGPA